MDSRTARRMATIRLAQAARTLCAEVGAGHDDGLSDADRRRMVNAFTALTFELDVRTGAVPREARPAPVDPNQEPLFELDKKGTEDGQEAAALPEAQQRDVAG